MFLRIIIFYFAFTCSYPCLAQNTVDSGKLVKAIPLAPQTSVVATPPINTITAPPKEVNKKKRKAVPVTAAQKQKPQAKASAK